jgi:hypothetical protein
VAEQVCRVVCGVAPVSFDHETFGVDVFPRFRGFWRRFVGDGVVMMMIVIVIVIVSVGLWDCDGRRSASGRNGLFL